MNASIVMPIRVATASDIGTQTVSVVDREKIMMVMANPGEYGPDVHRAITVLIAAGRSTADPLLEGRSVTATLGTQLQNLLGFMSDAMVFIDGGDVFCTHPDVPQFVPHDWAQSLNVRAVEDDGTRLPWLDEL